MPLLFSKTNSMEFPDHQRLVVLISDESTKLEKITDEEEKKRKAEIINFLLELQCITSIYLGRTG